MKEKTTFNSVLMMFGKLICIYVDMSPKFELVPVSEYIKEKTTFYLLLRIFRKLF